MSGLLDEEKLYTEKLKLEFSMTPEHITATMKYRDMTAKELCVWYRHSISVLKQCTELISQFTDDELVVIFNKPIYHLQRYYYAPIFSEQGFRHMKAYKLAKMIIETLIDRLVVKDLTKQNRYLKELKNYIGKLKGAEAKYILDTPVAIAESMLRIINYNTEVDITDKLEQYLNYVETIKSVDYTISLSRKGKPDQTLYVVPGEHYYAGVLEERNKFIRVITVRVRNSYDDTIQAMTDRFIQ